MKSLNEVKQLKLDVLSLVAKFAYDGTLDENIDKIPRMLIPGNVAKFRCCVYKEREIIRERVTLATAKALYEDEKPSYVVNVLKSACEGCPINRFNVTPNCQHCLTKNCLSACKFGAISMTSERAYIDQTKCKECGKCAQACPYNAISDTMRPCKRACPVDAISLDDDKLVKIKHEDCINCGACVSSCPFGAISDMSFIVNVIEDIVNGTDMYAMIAPAIEGQFGECSIGSIKEAIKDLGFKDVVEVALGADAVSVHEAEELVENKSKGKKMTTSCCPAFLALINKHFHDLVPNMSSTVSPMTATARYIKSKHPQSKTVFIGPCIAKKLEASDTADTADYVITFDELNAMFEAKEIDPSNYKGSSQDGSIYGKGYAVSGGVSSAVIRAMKENQNSYDSDITCMTCAGAKECKKALSLMKSNKMPEDIIEGMVCEGGCLYGPSSLLPIADIKKNRAKLMKNADSRTIKENVDKSNFKDIDMKRKYMG